MDVSVVIPARDEEMTIGACIDKAQAVFEALGVRGEVVVADSSKDNTRDVAERSTLSHLPERMKQRM